MDISLDLLLNPNIAFIGLVLAFLLTILALFVPGTGLIEVLAFIAIIYSIFAVASIPVNPIALLVLLFGVVPFVFALRRSGRRIYLIFSILALILGSSYLFVGEGWQPAVNPILAVIVSVLTAGFVWFMSLKLLAAEKIPPAHNPDQLIGETGEAATNIHDEGTIQINSELWSARSEASIPAGAHARVTGRDGFTLIVEQLPEEKHTENVSTG